MKRVTAYFICSTVLIVMVSGFSSTVLAGEQDSLFSSNYFWVVSAAVLGLIFAVFRAVDAYRMMNPPALNSEVNKKRVIEKITDYNFDFLEMVFFQEAKGEKAFRGMTALTFELLRRDLIKMKLAPQKRFIGETAVPIVFLNRKKEELPIEFVEKHEGVKVIYKFLFKKKELTFQDLIMETTIWSSTMQELSLKKPVIDFLSWERLKLKKWCRTCSLLSFFAAFGWSLYYVTSGWIVSAGMAIFFLLPIAGELIRYQQIVFLNNEGLIIKNIIEENIEKRREKLLALAEKEPGAALELISQEIPWLVLDDKISGGKFKRIKKLIRMNITEDELNEVELPGWIILDGNEGFFQLLDVLGKIMTDIKALNRL